MSLIFRCGEILSASISTANFLSESSVLGRLCFRQDTNFFLRLLLRPDRSGLFGLFCSVCSVFQPPFRCFFLRCFRISSSFPFRTFGSGLFGSCPGFSRICLDSSLIPARSFPGPTHTNASPLGFLRREFFAGLRCRPAGRRYRIEFIRMLALTSAIARMRLSATSLSAWWGFWLTSLT